MNGESMLRHPLVTRYLSELEHLLAGLHPAERAEVLAGVGEHLEESLAGSGGSDVAVRSALDELGPATAVADAAYDGRGQAPSTVTAVAPAAQVRSRPALSGSWVPPLVVVLQTLALMIMGLMLMTSPAGVEAEGSGSGWDVGVGAAIGTAAFWLVGTFLFWVPAAILVACSGLWRRREKAVPLAVVPVVALAMAFLLQVPLSVSGSLVGSAGLVVLLGLTGYLLTTSTRFALRRSAVARG